VESAELSQERKLVKDAGSISELAPLTKKYSIQVGSGTTVDRLRRIKAQLRRCLPPDPTTTAASPSAAAHTAPPSATQTQQQPVQPTQPHQPLQPCQHQQRQNKQRQPLDAAPSAETAASPIPPPACVSPPLQGSTNVPDLAALRASHGVLLKKFCSSHGIISGKASTISYQEGVIADLQARLAMASDAATRDAHSPPAARAAEAGNSAAQDVDSPPTEQQSSPTPPPCPPTTSTPPCIASLVFEGVPGLRGGMQKQEAKEVLVDFITSRLAIKSVTDDSIIIKRVSNATSLKPVVVVQVVERRLLSGIIANKSAARLGPSCPVHIYQHLHADVRAGALAQNQQRSKSQRPAAQGPTRQSSNATRQILAAAEAAARSLEGFQQFVAGLATPSTSAAPPATLNTALPARLSLNAPPFVPTPVTAPAPTP